MYSRVRARHALVRRTRRRRGGGAAARTRLAPNSELRVPRLNGYCAHVKFIALVAPHAFVTSSAHAAAPAPHLLKPEW